MYGFGRITEGNWYAIYFGNHTGADFGNEVIMAVLAFENSS